jgi:7-carboxy-7-deazaguanine synthase
MIEFHSDFHLKPVWDGEDQGALAEILNCIDELNIPSDKVWFMPAGDTRESLMVSYPKVMDWVRDNGFRFTGRPHIIAFDTERCV